MILAAIEAAIVERIGAVTSGHFAEITGLPASFDVEEPARVFRKLPGAYVAFLGGRADPAVYQRPEPIGRWGVYLVVPGSSGEEARRLGDAFTPGAYRLVEQVLSGLTGFTIAGHGALAFEEVQRLYSAAFDKAGLTVFGLTFSLTMSLTGSDQLDPNALAAFKIYHVDYVQPPVAKPAASLPLPAGEADASDTLTLPQ